MNTPANNENQSLAANQPQHLEPQNSTVTTPHQRAIAARALGLTKVYGHGDAQVVACNQINIEFFAAQFTAVMGPSGSGKSTLMHCMAGLDHLSGGQTWIGEQNITRLNRNQLTKLRRDKIGFIFQSFNLVPTLTAAENIVLPLSLANRKIDQHWYDTVTQALGLTERLAHKPSQLSGGQQQRVACARSLVSRPEVVFADEPTGNLDSVASAEVLNFMRSSVDEFGQTIVMVTHDPVAASYADRAVFLADGRIVDQIENPTRQAVIHQLAGLKRN